MIKIPTIPPKFQERARDHAESFVRRIGRTPIGELRRWRDAPDDDRIAIPVYANVMLNKEGSPVSAPIEIADPLPGGRLMAYHRPAYDPEYEIARLEALIYEQSVEERLRLKFGMYPLVDVSLEDIEVMMVAGGGFDHEDPTTWTDNDSREKHVRMCLARAESRIRKQESAHERLSRVASCRARMEDIA